MILTILEHRDTAFLDMLVDNFEMPLPVNDEQGRRVGSVIALWRRGTRLRAQLEVPPDDACRIRRVGLRVDLGLEDS